GGEHRGHLGQDAVAVQAVAEQGQAGQDEQEAAERRQLTRHQWLLVFDLRGGTLPLDPVAVGSPPETPRRTRLLRTAALTGPFAGLGASGASCPAGSRP